MTDVRTYTARPIEIQAIQVNQFGDFNRAVRWVRERGGDATFSPALSPGGTDCIILRVDGVNIDVLSGSWIVRDPDGQFRAVSNGSFVQYFELSEVGVAASGGTLAPPQNLSARFGDAPILRPGAALQVPE